MEKSIMFYYSPVEQPNSSPFSLRDGTVVWIRAEVKEGNYGDTLANANPYLGETVLNTVPYPHGDNK